MPQGDSLNRRLQTPQVTVRENHSEAAAREDEPKSSTSQPAT